MKKLLCLILALSIISCSGDDDGNTNNNSSNLTINPPSWIQGIYLQEGANGQILPIGHEFKTDDFCSVNSNLASCYQAQLDLFANSPNFETDVSEEIDSNRYFLEITIGVTIYSFEFEQVSSTSIKQILPTGELTFVLQ
ncbi:MAG: hypothetical protein P8O93_00205 [Flavobacteriaceae bacterium]|nr:hypothetical protein [Flavobacteriaceae bacterium]MDG1961562.1 hypothetical protein [Flavobacteriaceae bacterium]